MATARTGSVFGKYQLRRLLGRGGMGEVHEAYDTSKDRTVALKILSDELARDEEFRTRFQRESRLRCWKNRTGTRYQIRPDTLTIISPSGQASTEPVIEYSSS